ncbi:TAXI family TRAP transporter solute-binding subunit [Ferrovibrio sp.]|uniref:TAXI family TRAP transporter solute-binding subunit n=1 Tax=Ferrovibrio sp. TaxID=1917215 RepID=UPI0025B84D36|nr:TAXI family TRAP transporter solute-binding subunit [Ferrovibrio sp.]
MTSRPASRRFGACIGAAMVFAALMSDAAPAGAQSSAVPENTSLLRIGTGGQSGTYFPIGSLIARAVSDMPVGPGCAVADARDGRCGVPGLVAVAQTSNGSVANAVGLQNGEIEMALVQADVADWAFNAQEIFAGKGKHDRLRFVAHLYSEAMHVVVRREARISVVSDLRGRTVAMDEPGSGTLVHVRNLLGAYRLSETDLRPVYIKPDLALPRLLIGQLDAFFIVAGWPTKAVSDTLASGQASLVGIDADAANRLVRQNPFLSYGQIPAGTYPGQPAVSTLMVGAQLLVRADLADERVYAVLEALWNPRGQALLSAGHPRGTDVRFADALTGRTLPLHSGAERFYRAHGSLAN